MKCLIPPFVRSLALVTRRMSERTFSSQEATIVMPVLEDIIAHCLVPPLNIDFDDPRQGSGWLWASTIRAYETLTRIAPSACSLHDLQSTVDLMTRHWDQAYKDDDYHPCTHLWCWPLSLKTAFQ